jgi:NAD(P)-dependent dehydrogenase (short-subunit alcohol dehydrogenase family)
MAQGFRHRYHVSVLPHAADLSEPEAARTLWSGLEGAGVSVDILVNNAGVGLYGPFSDQAPDALARMVELNVGALTNLTRLALPGMRERRWGRILNIASLVAYQPGGPGMAAYYATKSYVLSLSKGLARELRGAGVSVTVVWSRTDEDVFRREVRGTADLPVQVGAGDGARRSCQRRLPRDVAAVRGRDPRAVGQAPCGRRRAAAPRDRPRGQPPAVATRVNRCGRLPPAPRDDPE